MPSPTTGSNTELQAVNQILASVGQAPVNTLTTESTYVLEPQGNFLGSISGTTLTTEEASIPVGTYISGTGVTLNTSIAVAGVAQGTNPETYNYTVNISQTVSSTNLVKSVVSYKVETQTNPEVAIAYNTLTEVSREVQSEGWTFNIERNYKNIQPDASTKKIAIPNNALQVDLSQDYVANLGRHAVNRGGYLYDTIEHTDVWDSDETFYLDIVWNWEYQYLPKPIQDYIVARAAVVFCSRVLGDSNQYQMLQQKEAFTRAMALEYECNQGNHSFFGAPQEGNFYKSYSPFNTLIR
tara:strand:- start:4667 stop:5554 length:888 start_codon:yes stop_codon:yes gene_type:complete